MSQADVAIIDSGGANIASLEYALARLGASSNLTTDASEIQSARRVILPGVGAAADAMRRLREADLIDTIRGLEQPVLGICLGMQLLCEASEEDDVACLGLLPGTAKKLASSPERPVPNMGWCALTLQAEDPLTQGLDDGSYCYFLHSYALPVSATTVATADHGGAFSAVVRQRNFVAAQFHPERSSAAGALMLQNFLRAEH